MVRVKDMSRRQQQAVFANMGDAGYLRRLESAEQYKRRTEYLKRKHDLAEDVEDKLFDVWDSKKLTHRQKMAKSTALKKEAKKKLEAYQKAEFAPTITGKIRTTQEKRFAKKYGISKIRKTNRASLEELEKGAKVEYAKGDKKLMTMETARRMAADNLKKNRDYYKNNSRRKPLKKDKTYKQLKASGIKLKPNADADKDGVKNSKDCRPLNKKKHVVGAFALAAAASFVGSEVSKRWSKKDAGHQKLYKDAYATKEEADDIAYYLTKEEHKKNVFVFRDKYGNWNIAYNE